MLQLLLLGGVTCAVSSVEQQVDGSGMREFWLAAKTSVRGVKHTDGAFNDLFHDGDVDVTIAPLKRFLMFNCFHHAASGFENFFTLLLPRTRHALQYRREAHTSVTVLRREISSAEKWVAIRREESGERPAALSADGLYRGLVACIDIRSLVAVHLHGDEVLVDDGGNGIVLIGFAVHHVAPMAPHGSYVEQNGFILGFCGGECFRPPLMPADGLMHGRSKIRR